MIRLLRLEAALEEEEEETRPVNDIKSFMVATVIVVVVAMSVYVYRGRGGGGRERGGGMRGM